MAQVELQSKLAVEAKLRQTEDALQKRVQEELQEERRRSEAEMAQREENMRALEATAEGKSWRSTWGAPAWASWGSGWAGGWGAADAWGAKPPLGEPPGLDSKKAVDGQKELSVVAGTPHISEKLLQTATATAVVEVETELVGVKTPPGSAARGTPTGGTAFPGAGQPLGKGEAGSGDGGVAQVRGGWSICLHCGQSTTARCNACMAAVCSECKVKHQRSSCQRPRAELCSLCGESQGTAPCRACEVWFCGKHVKHDCSGATTDP